MHTETQLDQTKEYVWILSDIEERSIKGKLTMLFTWTCQDTDVRIKEYLRVCNPLASCRIGKLMQALGWDETKEPNQTAQTFFVKGLHVKAKPLKHWSELNSEDMVWKLNYDELKPMEERLPSISDEDMKILQRISSSRRSHEEVLAHLATHRVDLIIPFVQLSKEGVFTFKH